MIQLHVGYRFLDLGQIGLDMVVELVIQASPNFIDIKILVNVSPNTMHIAMCCPTRIYAVIGSGLESK